MNIVHENTKNRFDETDEIVAENKIKTDKAMRSLSDEMKGCLDACRNCEDMCFNIE